MVIGDVIIEMRPKEHRDTWLVIHHLYTLQLY